MSRLLLLALLFAAGALVGAWIMLPNSLALALTIMAAIGALWAGFVATVREK